MVRRKERRIAGVLPSAENSKTELRHRHLSSHTVSQSSSPTLLRAGNCHYTVPAALKLATLEEFLEHVDTRIPQSMLGDMLRVALSKTATAATTDLPSVGIEQPG
jgi:hypothetical protein